jgi:hypothetical protein
MLLAYADDPEFAVVATRFEAIREHYREALTVMGVL